MIVLAAGGVSGGVCGALVVEVTDRGVGAAGVPLVMLPGRPTMADGPAVPAGVLAVTSSPQAVVRLATAMTSVPTRLRPARQLGPTTRQPAWSRAGPLPRLLKSG